MRNYGRIRTVSYLKREMVKKIIESKTHEDRMKYGKRLHELQNEMMRLLRR